MTTENSNHSQGTIVEIVTFQLKQAVTVAEFYKLDKAVEVEHVAQHPGFITR